MWGDGGVGEGTMVGHECVCVCVHVLAHHHISTLTDTACVYVCIQTQIKLHDLFTRMKTLELNRRQVGR